MDRCLENDGDPNLDMCIVYRHIRCDKNEPFYIGIGNNIKRAYNKTRRSNMWKSIIAKTDYEVEILFENISWKFAKEKEKEFIELYGRRDLNNGTLINFTNGGEGSLGLVRSEETRKKISEGLKGIKRSKETIQKIKDSQKGRVFSEEHKRKISESHKGKKLSEIHRKKISEGNKGRTPTEETIKKISKANIGKKHSEETKRKLSALNKGKNHPQYGKPVSEETKLKLSEAQSKKVLHIPSNKIYRNIRVACKELNLVYKTESSRMYRNSKKNQFKYI